MHPNFCAVYIPVAKLINPDRHINSFNELILGVIMIVVRWTYNDVKIFDD